MRVTLFTLCLLALPLSVRAQEVDCANAQVQIEMTFCAEKDFNTADEDLNAAYQAAVATLKEIDAAQEEGQRNAVSYLKDAQRAWIKFRDANCAAEGYLMHGGSAEPMVVYGCMARVTWARSNDLWTLASGNDDTN